MKRKYVLATGTNAMSRIKTRATGTHARPNTHNLKNQKETHLINRLDLSQRSQKELKIIYDEIHKRNGKINWAKIDEAYLEIDRKEDIFLFLDASMAKAAKFPAVMVSIPRRSQRSLR